MRFFVLVVGNMRMISKHLLLDVIIVVIILNLNMDIGILIKLTFVPLRAKESFYILYVMNVGKIIIVITKVKLAIGDFVQMSANMIIKLVKIILLGKVDIMSMTMVHRGLNNYVSPFVSHKTVSVSDVVLTNQNLINVSMFIISRRHERSMITKRPMIQIIS